MHAIPAMQEEAAALIAGLVFAAEWARRLGGCVGPVGREVPRPVGAVRPTRMRGPGRLAPPRPS